MQCQVIPCILEKTNTIVTAPTGTGKTLAYLLPILNNIKCDSKRITTVIMAPIQELVTQIIEQLSVLSRNINGVEVRCITKLSLK